MRTHELVLTANFDIEERVETGENWHARKYFLNGVEVMEKRVILVECPSGSVNINTQYNALGSFHETQYISLSREQLDFIRKAKL